MIRKPVHIITGFLRSGKSTFLNHFIKERLQAQQPELVFIIENEYAATNVDGFLNSQGGIKDRYFKTSFFTSTCMMLQPINLPDTGSKAKRS